MSYEERGTFEDTCNNHTTTASAANPQMPAAGCGSPSPIRDTIKHTITTVTNRLGVPQIMFVPTSSSTSSSAAAAAPVATSAASGAPVLPSTTTSVRKDSIDSYGDFDNTKYWSSDYNGVPGICGHAGGNCRLTSTASNDSSGMFYEEMVHVDTSSRLKVGIVLESLDTPVGVSINALHHPVSNCIVKALVVLNRPVQDVDDDIDGPVRRWLESVQLTHAVDEAWNTSSVTRGNTIEIFYGQEGYERLLRAETPQPRQAQQQVQPSQTQKQTQDVKATASSTDKSDDDDTGVVVPYVDAIFVVTSCEVQPPLVLDALKSNRHVLTRDRISSPYEDFREQLLVAASMSKIVQSSTMFLQHHRVQSFLDVLLVRHAAIDANAFGYIENIVATLSVHYDHLDHIGISNLPLQQGDGVIMRLARYCVLISVLLLSRLGSRPVSARVETVEMSRDESSHADLDTDDIPNEPVEAQCVVTFSDNRQMSCFVEYTAAPTRQILEVQSASKTATMTDFVIAHPDGLSNYRVYDKQIDPTTGKLAVVKGEALDLMSGPTQDVMMWRKFAHSCRVVEQDGYTDPTIREYTNIVLQTKRVLIALEESLKRKLQDIDDNAVHEVPVILEDDVLLPSMNKIDSTVSLPGSTTTTSATAATNKNGKSKIPMVASASAASLLLPNSNQFSNNSKVSTRVHKPPHRQHERSQDDKKPSSMTALLLSNKSALSEI